MSQKRLPPKIEELPDVLTLVEAGLVLNYSEDYLRKQAIKGNFPAFQCFNDGTGKGSWRIFRDDLVRWLTAKRPNINAS